MARARSKAVRAAKPVDVSKAQISYIKSNLYRVIFAEGAYGGVSPRGMISFALYNERQAIPRNSEVTVTDRSVLSEAITDTRGGLVREVEAQIMMGLDEAAELSRWLAEKVEFARQLTAGDGDGN